MYYSGCPGQISPTFVVTLRAYPVSDSCPSLSTRGLDGQCHCVPGYVSNSNTNTCIPISLVNSPAPEKTCQAVKVGDPIYPLTGAVAESIDLQLGNGPQLFYDTSLAMTVVPDTFGSKNTGAAAPGWTILGGYWFLFPDKRIVRSPAPVGGILLYTGTGEAVAMADNGQGTYVAAESSRKIVPVGADLYSYDYKRNTLEIYGGNGILKAIYSSDGSNQTLTYSDSSTPAAIAPTPGYVIASTDTLGRSLIFSYETLASNSVRLASLQAPTETVQFGYDSNSNLASVAWLQAASSQTFQYDPSSHWALTTVNDESARPWLQYSYDSAGRARSQNFGNGSGGYSVTYSDAGGNSTSPAVVLNDVANSDGTAVYRTLSFSTPPTVNIALPNGNASVVNPALVNGIPLGGTSTQPAGAGCGASSSTLTYDSFGNVASRDDFNGNRRCYAYDTARGLRTQALEGRAKTNACSMVPSTADPTHPERLITTAWHPDWALKVREAEAKKITTWVYNGQPDPIAGGTAHCASTAPALPDGKPIAVVCARYEQATTDSTGALGLSATTTGMTRAWTYTYNQFGQMLTETTPKMSTTDSLSHTTTYVYYSDTSMNANVGHTIGDLQSVTNPLQQTTNFTSYDGAGRLLSSNDANGVLTTLSYWPRGWLKRQTMTPPGAGAPQVTMYDYWPTGLLKTVTMPDASTLNYAYDDAHRLTDITDAAGNKVHYVLDNDGNRTSEQITDASGNLASTVTRVFDALNRVQSQTGLVH
jgi:YD repeat-containing protein